MRSGVKPGMRREFALRVPDRDSSERRALPCSIRVDDWVFGVSSVSKDGFESPVASAVPGGAFKPYVTPADGRNNRHRGHEPGSAFLHGGTAKKADAGSSPA